MTPPPPPLDAWAYFLDLDGTLVDLADSPAGVRMDPDIRRLVEQLYRSTGGAVALISGRAINEIDALLPGLRFPAAGQHGVERRDAAGHISHHPFPTERLAGARERLAAAAARHPGLWLEDKGMTLALHYRQAPRLGGFAHRLARSVIAPLDGQYGVQTGKRVVEMKPTGKDKGIAVLEFMEEAPFRNRTPVFVGDDRTDEHGFATVNRLRGYSVKVGPGRTVARWRLADVGAVRAWLARSRAPAGLP